MQLYVSKLEKTQLFIVSGQPGICWMWCRSSKGSDGAVTALQLCATRTCLVRKFIPGLRTSSTPEQYYQILKRGLIFLKQSCSPSLLEASDGLK